MTQQELDKTTTQQVSDNYVSRGVVDPATTQPKKTMYKQRRNQ